jgi:hypothetical protein
VRFSVGDIMRLIVAAAADERPLHMFGAHAAAGLPRGEFKRRFDSCAIESGYTTRN